MTELDAGSRAFYEREVERLAAQLQMTREDLIDVVSRALASDSFVSPAPLELRVCIVGAPIATNRAYAPVVFKSKKFGRYVAKIRLTPEGEAWREKIARQMLAARQMRSAWRCDAPRYLVRIIYHFASPSSDIDGPIKLTLDALKPHIFEDDRQIAELNVKKFVDRAEPRIEIAVRALEVAPPRQETLL